MDKIAGLTAPELIPKTGHIVAAMAKDPTLYQAVMSIFPTLEELEESHEANQATYNATAGGDPAKLKEHEAVRQLLNQRYNFFLGAVKLAATVKPDLLEIFGLDIPKSKKSSSISLLTSPLNPRIQHGQESGQMILKVEPVKYAKCYGISICEGDPSLEENWRHYGVGVKASKLEVAGLTPGKVYWFRVRAIGSHGPGPWSKYVSLMSM